jgi:hypothetical protein
VPLVALASTTEAVSLGLSAFSAPDLFTGELNNEQAKAIAVSEMALRFRANILIISPPK